MTFLIKTLYIILTIGISAYIYTWAATFKQVAEFSDEEWDEVTDEASKKGKEVERLSSSQKNTVGHFNQAMFVLLSSLIWIIMGVTMGKIASDVTQHAVLKWFIYIGMYFLFLRIPFGLSNKLIQLTYEFDHFPEKSMFAILMIGFYILSICCYEALPGFLKWHLVFLP